MVLGLRETKRGILRCRQDGGEGVRLCRFQHSLAKSSNTRESRANTGFPTCMYSEDVQQHPTKADII